MPNIHANASIGCGVSHVAARLCANTRPQRDANFVLKNRVARISGPRSKLNVALTNDLARFAPHPPRPKNPNNRSLTPSPRGKGPG